MTAHRVTFDNGRAAFRVGDRVTFRVNRSTMGAGLVTAVDVVHGVTFADGRRVPFYAVQRRAS